MVTDLTCNARRVGEHSRRQGLFSSIGIEHCRQCITNTAHPSRGNKKQGCAGYLTENLDREPISVEEDSDAR